MKKVLIFLSLIVCIVLVSTSALGDGPQKSLGQTVYANMNHNCQEPWDFTEPLLPAGECTWSVNTRLFIRNLDQDNSITVTEINIHDPDGNFLLNWLVYFGGAVTIGPLASKSYAVPGGPPNAPDYWSAVHHGRPSFIVKWEADSGVHPPLIGSGHVIMNRDPKWSPNPQQIEGLSTSVGVVLENIPAP